MNLVSDFKNELIRVCKSTNTIESYINDIKEFMTWFEGTYGKFFDGIMIDNDIRLFRQYLTDTKKRKASTISRKLNALKLFNNYLVAAGYGHEVKIEPMPVEGKNEKNIKVLKKSEYDKLRRAFYTSCNKRDIAIFEVLANTGIRVSELTSLEKGDISLAEGSDPSNYSYITVRSHNGGKYRKVNLNAESMNAIIEYEKVRPQSNSNIFFLGQRGPLTRSAVLRILHKYCSIASIEPISPNTLRHTWATYLIKSGVPLIVVSRLAGHSSVKVTSDFYLDTDAKNKQDTVDVIMNEYNNYMNDDKHD